MDGLSLAVEKGEAVALIGPNGAGKTTVLNLISGLYPVDEGDVLLDGESVVGLEPHAIARRGVSRTFQTLRLFPNMTVKENVLAATYNLIRSRVFQWILRTPAARAEQLELEKLADDRLELFADHITTAQRDRPAHTLSYANRRRLEFARALAPSPRLLLLDEPSAGMNPAERRGLAEVVSRVGESGCSTIIVEHDMRVVERVADRVVALDRGAKLTEGSFAQVLGEEQVIRAYLGPNAPVG